MFLKFDGLSSSACFLILSSLIMISSELNISFFTHIPYAGFPYSNDELGPAIDLAIADLTKQYSGSQITIHHSAPIFPGIYRCDQSMAIIAQLSARYYFSDVGTHQQTVFVFFVAGKIFFELRELAALSCEVRRDSLISVS